MTYTELYQFKKTILLPLIITAICIIFFGTYGYIEFTVRTNAVWDFAKKWADLGAKHTGNAIEKFGNPQTIWSGKYKELSQNETRDRFALQNAEITEKCYIADYIGSVFLHRTMNEMERRYTNQFYLAMIIDRAGYVPTGKDRQLGTESVWDWYSGDKTKDSVNYSHRFWPHSAEHTKYVNSEYQIKNKVYAGSYIIINERIWGTFTVEFCNTYKQIKDEILKRIILLSLGIGMLISVIVKIL